MHELAAAVRGMMPGQNASRTMSSHGYRGMSVTPEQGQGKIGCVQTESF